MKTFKAIVSFKDTNQCGFIGNRRVYDGDVIDVTDSTFSKKWMKRVPQEREVKTPPQRPKSIQKHKKVGR